MTTRTSNHYNAGAMPVCTEAGDEKTYVACYTFPDAPTLASGDIFRMARLSDGYSVTGVTLDCGALGTSCAAAVGILTDDETDIDTTIIGAASVATAVARRRADTTAGCVLAPATVEKTIGVKITTSAAAAVVAGVKIWLTINYRPKQKIEG